MPRDQYRPTAITDYTCPSTARPKKNRYARSARVFHLNISVDASLCGIDVGQKSSESEKENVSGIWPLIGLQTSFSNAPTVNNHWPNGRKPPGSFVQPGCDSSIKQLRKDGVKCNG